jgi:hypothetical protein
VFHLLAVQQVLQEVDQPPVALVVQVLVVVEDNHLGHLVLQLVLLVV